MSTLSRVIFSPDTTPPTVPSSVTATAQSTTTIRIAWAASTDTGGAGLAGYRVYRSATSGGTYTQVGTDLTTASLTFDDTGLSASATWFYRVLAFDGNGNASALSTTVSATTQGGSGSTETVGSWAARDLTAQKIYRIDSSLGDMPVFVVEGATHTLETNTGWDGGYAHKITPIPPGGGPTGEGAMSLGSFIFDSSLNIRKLNVRFEVQFGSAWGVNLVNQIKWIIVHTSTTPTGEQSNERPMYYLANMGSEAGDAPAALQVDGMLAFGVASGTTKNFEPLQSGNPGYNWPRGREDFLFGTSATTISGKRIVPLTDWYTIELEMIAESTAAWTGSPAPPSGAANGLIRGVIWNRTGEQLTDLYIPWNWDGSWTVGDYIREVQLIGGYGNATQVPGANNYMRLAGITFAANRPGLIRPRSGF